VANFIARRMCRAPMLAAVDLNDQPPPKADKVDNVAFERSLAPEVIALLPQCAEPRPQADLLWRHALAEMSGDLVRHSPGLPHAAMDPHPAATRPPSPQGELCT